MFCPKCESSNVAFLPVELLNGKTRQECMDCGHKFETIKSCEKCGYADPQFRQFYTCYNIQCPYYKEYDTD